MNYATEYVDLLGHVLDYLRSHQGKTIHVSSHLMSARGNFDQATMASTQQSFPYAVDMLSGTANKLLLMATDNEELFELQCDRISQLEIKDNEVMIEEELGGYFRYNVLRVDA